MAFRTTAGLSGPVVVLAALAGTPAQAANIFEELGKALFGRPQPRQMMVAPADPLHVTVKPRRKRAGRTPAVAAAAAEVSSKPPPPVVKLDPAQDGRWYLKDPTLRRGDIVVTTGGVLVYRGPKADLLRAGDFTALGGKAGDKGWKGQLQAAAAGGRNFFDDPAPPQADAASSFAQSEQAGRGTDKR